MNIYKIVLTGGPCAGKTKVLEGITEKLNNSNYYVITIPETASYLISNKMFPQGNKKHNLKFQELVLQVQTTKEQIAKDYCQSIIDNNSELLKNKDGIIILCDRGIMDNRAYLSHTEYNNLLKKYNLNELELLNNYDLVIDLISTATAKPESYELNGIRYETIEEAALRDQITSSAWLLHPNLYVIKPTDTIEEKIDLVYLYIMNHINQRKRLNLQNISYLPVDKDRSDFSIFNDDNSRKIKITSYNMNNFDTKNYVLDKKQYNDNTLYIIKKDYSNSLTTMSNDTYNQLLRFNLLEEINTKDIIHFIHNGNYYYIVENSLGMILYSNQKQIEDIPKSIVLKKSLIK